MQKLSNLAWVDAAGASHVPDDFRHCDMAQLLAQQGWQAQYKLLIEWGRAIADKPWLRHIVSPVMGCEVPIWLMQQSMNGRVFYFVDCDSRVIKGLLALLLAPLQGRREGPLALEGINAPLRAINIARHLTPSRNNGLAAIAAALVENAA